MGLLALCWLLSASGHEVALSVLPGKNAPAPERIVDGSSDGQFRDITGSEIAAEGRGPYWWRIRFNGAMSEGREPQLVLEWPQRKSAELWMPGAKFPVRRSVYGPDADFTHTPRVLSFPLGRSIKPGDTVYLRVTSVNMAGSQVALQSQSELLREEIRYAQIRSVQMTVLGLIAVISICLFVSLRERGYAYLAITLLLQMSGLLAEGGELRSWSILSVIAMDARTNIVLNTAAVLASVRFLIFFLGLRQRQRLIARLLDICSALLGGLLLVSFFAVWRASALLGNMVLLVVIVTVVAAISVAVFRKQREAAFLLVAWTPMIVVITTRIGSLHQWWPTYDWLEYGYSNAMTAGGLGLLLGLADKLHQLRRDRDVARHRATFDPLTLFMTRGALVDALSAAVATAHIQQKASIHRLFRCRSFQTDQ
ncbi:7TM diverse intracellular signaling domain-containing protein [Lysobacter enzymogenes]|uniref:7TM diverse intracellular signaling domain-containing protein n=1 Tax=Lysobacter enzymogenes TaxID=69 RepID=UPI0022653A37|nr:7TM diverse intracellular signaling domain-containing protein [Lysobacter enzymogenes]UZW61862.1 7TM-DISM domain-containing protein [Lysobacter enzymogenes]